MVRPETIEEFESLIGEGVWDDIWSREKLGIKDSDSHIWLALAQEIHSIASADDDGLCNCCLKKEDDEIGVLHAGPEMEDGNAKETDDVVELDERECEGIVVAARIICGMCKGCKKFIEKKRSIYDLGYMATGEVEERYRRESGGHKSRLIYLSLIKTGIENKGWDVCLPPYPVIIRRDAITLKSDDVEILKKARHTKNKFMELLRSKSLWIEENPTASLILSAIVMDGLIDRDAIKSLYESLGRKLAYGNSGAWIDLLINKDKPHKRRVKRYWPGPVTTNIWFLGTHDVSEDDSVEVFMSEALKGISDSEALTYKQFLRGMRGDLSNLCAEIVVGYAVGNVISTPVKADRWLQMSGFHNVENILSELDPTHNVEVSEEEVQDGYEDSDYDLNHNDDLLEYVNAPGYELLKLAMRSENVVQMRKRLKDVVKVGADNSPIITMLAEWLSSTKLRAKARTRRHMFSIVGRRLVSLVGGADIRAFDDDEIAGVYRSVISDGKSVSHRISMRESLSKFHHHSFESVSSDVSDALKQTEAPEISAYIITHDEYCKILEELGRPSSSMSEPEWVEACQLIFILLFRLGLRRNELLYLPLHDIHGRKTIEILIRPFVDRSIKTRNALRTLLVNGFLSVDEKNLLEKWLSKRRNDAINNQSTVFLWSIPDKGVDRIPEDTIIKRIVSVMRRVTGNESLHIHHLRHSFSTWGSVALIGDSEGIDFSLFSSLPKTQEWLNSFSGVIDELYFGEPIHRNRQYLMSTLLGHSSPTISMEHYVHGMDLVLRDVTRKNSLVDDKVLEGSVLGVPYRTLKRWREGGWDQVEQMILKKSANKVLHYSNTDVSNHDSQECDWSSLYDDMRICWDVLKMIHDGRNVHDMGLATSLSEAAITTLVTKSSELVGENVIAKGYPTLKSMDKSLVIIENWLQRAAINFNDDSLERKLTELSCFWIKHKRKKRAAARFADTDSAREYVNLLRNAGVVKAELKLSLVTDQRSKKRLKKMKETWCSVLSIPKEHPISNVSLGGNRTLDEGEGYMDITVCNPGKTSASAEFQWIMVMMACLTKKLV